MHPGFLFCLEDRISYADPKMGGLKQTKPLLALRASWGFCFSAISKQACMALKQMIGLATLILK
jgi:hypothetical protein